MSDSFPFLKGHGTENDFVLLPDPDGTIHGDLDAGLVAALCDRRTGLGGDGVLRAIRSAAYDDPDAVGARGKAEWFMDYRNSDGSCSQMCGNGIRVFARYLAESEGVDTSRPVAIGTRDGIKAVTFEADGTLTADMGTAQVFDDSWVSLGDRMWPATHVDVGNPHAVAFVEDLAEAGPLLESPRFDTLAYPDGVNIEFVVRRGDRHVAMRVFERGSGETRSCGTGACAVVVATAIADQLPAQPELTPGSTRTNPRLNEDVRYRVDVPGGELAVTWTAGGRLLLNGPAVMVAEGRIRKSFAPGSGSVQRSKAGGNTSVTADVDADGCI